MKVKEIFEDLLEHKRKCGSNPLTIRNYKQKIKNILVPAIGDVEVADLKLEDVDIIYRAGRLHGRYGSHRAIVIFRQLIKFIQGLGYKFNFHWRDVPVPPEPQRETTWLDTGEWHKLIEGFDLTKILGLRDRAMAEVLRATGISISEALALNRTDIDWQNLRAAVQTKGFRRAIYFTPECLELLKKYIAARQDNEPALFASYTGRCIRPLTFRRAVYRVMDKVGIKKHIHAYLFQNTVGRQKLNWSVDLQAVQNIINRS